MGRHRTPEEKRHLGERARELRAAGRSRREIRLELGIGEHLVGELLAGVQLPGGLRRPRAKDDVRAEAVALRLKGMTYGEIAERLEVSKSSCSLWLRELPHPAADPERAVAAQGRRVEALRAQARRQCAERDEADRALTLSAASSVGEVTARDLVLALAVSYWCEGAKRKQWSRQQSVRWMNSDPVLVSLFLEGLRLLGVERERLSLRLHIHESADEEAARRWWAAHTGVPLEQFRRSTIKRHNPKTTRRNVGDSYRGCLCVRVLQSRQLYDVLDGLVRGLAGMPRGST